jgi:predicted phosphodiesterase
MPMKMLAVADLHLGRAPSRLPDGLSERARDLGPAGAWQRIVDAAIDAHVDALVLAGDVVEEEHDYFEAYRELATTIGCLLKADVRVLAVVGNHDVQVLPRLADQIAGFQLLGRGGNWQRTTLEAGSERVTLHGWSFPQRVIRTSPLTDHRFKCGPGPNLGLLHCDRDQSGSAYAPVTTAEINAAGLDGWLLGHIHAPDDLNAELPAGYLGSATGVDPGEPGDRGPWLVMIEGGRIVALEQWVLAPLRWERLSVDLTGIDFPEDARDRLLEAVSRLDRTLSARPTPPEAVGLRVTFTGRTNLRRAVESVLANEDLDTLYAGSGDIHYFVERHRYVTRPELDIDTLANRADPPGLLARQLQLLERTPDDRERRALIQTARRHLAERAGKPYWQPLEDAAPDEETVSELLRQAGLAILDSLLAQREGTE